MEGEALRSIRLPTCRRCKEMRTMEPQVPNKSPDGMPESKGRRRMLAIANGIDRLITRICRFVVLVTGITLTVLLTANVVARYALATGGIDAAEEIPERLFPWFIVAGIALAAQAGGHMSVDWVLDRLGPRGRRWLLLLANTIVFVSYLVIFQQAMVLSEIAKVERSPVLNLPGSHGYWAIAFGCLLLALATACTSVRLMVTGPETRFAIEYKET
jgi:TRAP-type C4-dicarboxylate transport system permease small subunit